MLYTAWYEDFKQIFFTTIGGNFYYVAAGSDGVGMDDANHVHDEVSVKIWRRFGQFFGSDRVDDTFYRVNYYPVCMLYCGNICL